jgi:hypothetical protein
LVDIPDLESDGYTRGKIRGINQGWDQGDIPEVGIPRVGSGDIPVPVGLIRE